VCSLFTWFPKSSYGISFEKIMPSVPLVDVQSSWNVMFSVIEMLDLCKCSGVSVFVWQFHINLLKPNGYVTHHQFNPLNPELNPICYLLALLGAHHFLHVSRIRVKLLTFRLLMSYVYGAPILDVSSNVIYIWSTHSWCF